MKEKILLVFKKNISKKLNISFHLDENNIPFDLRKVELNFYKVFEEIVKELKKDGMFFNKYSVSVNLTYNKEIQELNNIYKDKDKPTDVLSFPSGNLSGTYGQNKELDLGDIFINVDILDSQAKSINSNIEMEVVFLFMHGLLHLIGYDHVNNEDEAEKMYTRQREILKITKIREEGL